MNNPAVTSEPTIYKQLTKYGANFDGVSGVIQNSGTPWSTRTTGPLQYVLKNVDDSQVVRDLW